jgi:hypothetical protein
MNMDSSQKYFVFKVNDEPYALWDADIAERTNAFLNAIDPEYFSYLGEIHIQNMDSAENKHRAATVLRMTYLHGLETLMTLIGATVQAPQAPYAWVALAKTTWIRSVISQISSGDCGLDSEFTTWNRTWEELVKIVFQSAPSTDGWTSKTPAAFATAWRLLAREFLNEDNQREYNSLKHGFRILSSGVHIRIGKQTAKGVPASPKDMNYLGGSDTGSTFFTLESAGPDNAKTRSRISALHTVNWAPLDMLLNLKVVDVSISNIISYLRIVNGADPVTTLWHSLENFEQLSSNVGPRGGITAIKWRAPINAESIELTTKASLSEEIAAIRKRHGSGQ